MELFNQLWQEAHQTSHHFLKEHPPIREEYRRYRRQLQQARRFKIDNDALDLIIELGEDADWRTILGRIQLARLPFPIMWVEIDLHHKTDYRNAKGYDLPRYEDTPKNLGWLLEEDPANENKWMATCFTDLSEEAQRNNAGDGLRTTPGLIQNHLDISGGYKNDYGPDALGEVKVPQMVTVEDSKAHTETNFIMKAFPWGAFRGGPDNKIKSYIIDHNTWSIEPVIGYALAMRHWELTQKDDAASADQAVKEAMIAGHREHSGDLRFLVTLLATLNCLPTIMTPVKPYKASFRDKQGIRPYLTSSVVTINIPAKRSRLKMAQKMLKTEIAKRRRHEVRGHWRTADKAIDGWEPFMDERGRIRWRKWISAHMRGDGSLGFVNHDYEVQAS